jgi:hypothetical protein
MQMFSSTATSVTPYFQHFAANSEEEIYSSSSSNPMSSIHQHARYSDLLHQDAQSVVLYTSSPPPQSRPQLQYDSPDDEEMQKRANFARRKEWMKWVTKWIAQTEMGGNRKVCLFKFSLVYLLICLLPVQVYGFYS